jgi:Dolichyl-phosphate-mannose-protein mannosyltransferase
MKCGGGLNRLDSGQRFGRVDVGPPTLAIPRPLWAILALSLTLNLWGIWFGLPDSWHPDELVSRSVAMARQFTLIPSSYLYGSMHYYLMLAVIVPTYLVTELLSLPVDMQKTAVYLAARALSAVMGSGCVIMTYLVGRSLFNQQAALVAALLLAISIGLVNLSHFATVDVPMLFWMMAAYLMSARVLNGGYARDYLLAGAFAGMAAGTKYVGGMALVALVAAYLLREGNRYPKHLVVAIIAAVGTFILVNLPAVLFASCAFFEGFIIDNAYNTTTGADPGEVLGILVVQGLLRALGMPIAVIAAFALTYAVIAAMNKRCVRETVFLFSTLLPYSLLISNIHYGTIRHVLPMIPPLFILIGKTITDLVGRSAPHGPRRWFGYGMFAVAVLVSALQMLSAELQFTFDGRNLAATWIMQHAAPGSTVEVTWYGPQIPEERFLVRERPRLRNLDNDIMGLKDAAVYRVLYPIYLKYKSVAERVGVCQPRARHYTGWYEQAQSKASVELTTFDPSLEGLEARAPDLLVVSSFWYERFMGDPTGPDGRFFQQLFEDGGRYRQVAEFDYALLPWLDPNLESINPTVRIYQRQPVEP